MSRKSQSRKTRFVLVCVAGLLIVLFSIKALRLVQSSVWDGAHHITIAIDNGDIDMWSIEPKEKAISHVVIPATMFLTVPPSYGEYEARAVGKLSLLERGDGTLLQDAVSETLAVPVDAYIVRRNEQSGILALDTLFGLFGIGEVMKRQSFSHRLTNLTWYDMVRLWFLSFGLKKEAVETFRLADSDAVTQTSLPDQRVILVLAQDRFATRAPSYFTDKKIAQEQLTIEVINGTEREGAANNLALILSNIGATVINTAKSEEPAGKNVVFAKERSYTASKIAKLIHGELQREAFKDSRADITVVLGGD